MLTEEPLPRWASGRRIVAVGAQTNRPVDDVGLITDAGGWVTIQAKKGMRVDRRLDGGLGEALRQVVEIDAVGVPDGGALRPLEPARDLVLILSDDSVAATVNASLAKLVDRLRNHVPEVPVSELATTRSQAEALGILQAHLSLCWKERWSSELTEADFRRMTRALSVRALRIAEGGEDYATTVRGMLRDLAGDIARAETLWKALLAEAQRLAEERTYLNRNDLITILDAQGIVLQPVARLRSDIDRLRAQSTANVGLLGKTVSIASPERPVRLIRSVEAALLGAVDNVAVTGVPGSGKSALLHALAAATQATHDLVVLRAADLRSSNDATRRELKLKHDLAEVLNGWSSRRPGLVLIDGIDQARDADAPDWLPTFAESLSETRWRIVASVRAYNLKRSRRWKEIFPGTPVDAGAADPELDSVRHLLVGDLTDEELAAVRRGSPRLAALLDAASPRLRMLLANPFNLDLAGQLIKGGSGTILQVHTRAELLAEYWRRRVGRGPEALGRVRTLRALVFQMMATGRQAVSSLDLPPDVTAESLEDLYRSGVLRQSSVRPGRIDTPTAFAHSVLFDFAVAMLALGDLEQPESLADVLDGNPNLAITVRPSLEYRIGDAWSADTTRRDFWRLALRLASHAPGHPLAASEAARVAARQMNHISDLVLLVDAATGVASDQAGRWGQAEARYLAYLLAVATGRTPRLEALTCIDALASVLASRARTADDIDLALAAAQLPFRATGSAGAKSGSYRYSWTVAAAADCMAVALKDPADQSRTMLVDPSARLLALAAVSDPLAAAQTIVTVISAEALHGWGTRAIRHLIPIIPAIAEAAPDLAVAIGKAPWEYEETRTTRTTMIRGSILQLTSTLQQDLEGERYAVGTQFAGLIVAAPIAATTLFLDILRLPRMYQFPSAADWREPPAVRQGRSLASAGGHQVLVTMTDTFAEGLQNLAEADLRESDGGHPSTTLGRIVARLVSELTNDEVWRRLLLRAATAQSGALARALLPALSTPTLYAHHETWNEAAHAACRAAPLLTTAELTDVQEAVRWIADACITPRNLSHRTELEQRTTAILSSLQAAIDTPDRPSAATQSPEDPATVGLPLLQDVFGRPIQEGWMREPAVPGSFGDLAQRAHLRLQDSTHTQQADGCESCDVLVTLWDELVTIATTGDSDDPNAADLAVEIAGHLTSCPSIAPLSALGMRITTTLVDASPSSASLQASAAARDADQSSWASSITPSWGVTAETRSAQALVRLCADQAWRRAYDQEIRQALTALLDGPDPLYRLIAVDALPALSGEQDKQIEELERYLAQEMDQHVATRLIYILSKYVNQDPGRVDNVLERLAATQRWTVLSASSAGEQPVGRTDEGGIGAGVIAALGAVYGTPFARGVLDTWLTEPVDHPQRAASALHSLSYLINPATPAARPAQERLLGVVGKGLAQVRTTFTRAVQGGGTLDEQARLSDAIRYAGHVSLLLYSESGAMDSGRQSPAPPQRGDLARFALLSMPLLEELSAIHVPSITQHVVQTADRIAAVSPKKVLLIAVKAVTGDEAFWHELAGAEAVLGFVRHFAAENRAVFLGDHEAIEAVRRMLESFVRMGWYQAIELAEELDELFT
jgi:hypothetical protein